MPRLSKAALQKAIELNLPEELFDADVETLRNWALNRMMECMNTGKAEAAVRSIVNMAYVVGYRAGTRDRKERTIK